MWHWSSSGAACLAAVIVVVVVVGGGLVVHGAELVDVELMLNCEPRA